MKGETMNKLSKLPAKSSQAATIRDLLHRQKDQLVAALPKHMDVEKVLRVAMTSIQSNPVLLQCDQMSLVKALMEASQLGLVTDGILGYAYLVPYKVKGIYKAQLQIGYRGFLDLAYRSGKISSIYAIIVRENDDYDYSEGLERTLMHKPSPKMGELIAAYAVVKYKDGASDFEWMWKAEIDAIRRQSKASEKGPWATHYTEMARKTPIRKLAKRLPLQTEKDEPIAKYAVEDEYRDQGLMDVDMIEEKTTISIEEMKKDIREEPEQPETQPQAPRTTEPPQYTKEELSCPVPTCKFVATSPTGLKKHITQQTKKQKNHSEFFNPLLHAEDGVGEPIDVPPAPDAEFPDAPEVKEQDEPEGFTHVDEPAEDIDPKKLVMMSILKDSTVDIRAEAFARMDIKPPEALSELTIETLNRLNRICTNIKEELNEAPF